MSFDDALDRACADGKVSTADADEIRRFAAFLDAAGPRPGPDATPEERDRFYTTWREHYPDDFALAVAEAEARKARGTR